MNKNLINPFPKELDNDATAWAYLRQRFPLYFQGVGRLPGETDKPTITIINPQVDQDIITVAKYHLKDLKLADIAEALTGSRLYAGSNLVRRLQAIQSALKTTTTTPEISLQDDFGAEVAA
jgi:hypothetical protein